MSDKAREFWILESRCTGKSKPYKTQLECWGEIQHNENEIHVIEYSAYKSILKELSDLKALRKKKVQAICEDCGSELARF